MKLEQNELDVSDVIEFDAEDELSEQANGKLPGWLREIVETLLLAGFIWLAFNVTTARFVVEGQSMEPNVHTGEFILVTKTSYWFSEPGRGDIIVFRFPNNPKEDFIKRIVGLPGDNIELQNGQFLINGEPLEELFGTIPTTSSGMWSMGQEEYFVVGDNRANSSDSRSWGPLGRQAVIGKAWLIYWPPKEWSVAPHQVYASP